MKSRRDQAIEFRDWCAKELEDAEKMASVYESGEMRHSQKPDGGTWVDITDELAADNRAIAAKMGMLIQFLDAEIDNGLDDKSGDS